LTYSFLTITFNLDFIYIKVLFTKLKIWITIIWKQSSTVYMDRITHKSNGYLNLYSLIYSIFEDKLYSCIE